MKSDITVLNSRKDRIEMALKDVLEEYNHRWIDERYKNDKYLRGMYINTTNLINVLCSKLPWPISKIRDFVKKYEVTYSYFNDSLRNIIIYNNIVTCSTTTEVSVNQRFQWCTGKSPLNDCQSHIWESV